MLPLKDNERLALRTKLEDMPFDVRITEPCLVCDEPGLHLIDAHSFSPDGSILSGADVDSYSGNGEVAFKTVVDVLCVECGTVDDRYRHSFELAITPKFVETSLLELRPVK